MRLTTKGRFAVTAMIDLALRESDGPVTLAGIAERQQISLSYLEQLFGKLRRNQLVASTRGPGGGYTLAKPLAAVTVADIISAVDEPLDATSCGGRGNSTQRSPPTGSPWPSISVSGGRSSRRRRSTARRSAIGRKTSSTRPFRPLKKP